MADIPAQTAKVVLVVLASVIGIGSLVALSLRPRPPEIVPWKTDLAAAQKEAEATHKKVFIDFTAEWCEPCQSLRHTTWANQHVVDALGNYIPVSINVDNYPDLARKYNVISIPQFVVLDGNTAIKRSVGALDSEQFVQWLKSN